MNAPATMDHDRSRPAHDHYDLVVIGAGAAGLVAAGGAAQLGARTLLIEQHRLGGECLFTGCVPSKALIAIAAKARGGAPIDWAAAHRAVHGAIATIEPHDSPEVFEDFGVEVVFGHARFAGRDAIEVGGRRVTGRRFVIATGSDPAVPPIAGIHDVPFNTNETIFDIAERPDHLVIIGGGAIGCELSQSFARLGSEVTLVDVGTLLPRDDPDAVAVVRRQLVADGVVLHESVKIASAAGGAGAVRLTLADGSVIAGSHLLVAAGRAARLAGYGLDIAGVASTKAGITVDKYLRTSNPRIFAIGDCREGPRLTHAANQDARCVIQNALFPFRKAADYSALPAVTYTDPELGQVGLTEAAARTAHPRVEVLRHDFDHIDRSIAEHDVRGFLKIMAVGNKVVGATIVGAHVGELVALLGFAVSGKLSLGDLANHTYAYPTLSEVIRFAAEKPGQARLFTPFMRRVTGLFQKLP
ncbi:dihydrolipoyl dehydrogenase family protein [Sandarakinorhabdus sp. DWP1-3-1]|uniref:dihydrolipoyl dehydrogenase family protein n=1 Tax=Sandarakinorhabdus sp. DWP1-3-1 TaxID=2804627 RepID=UPI003CF663E2